MQDLHGYGQLQLADGKAGPDRVMTVDAMLAPQEPEQPSKIHLRISDVAISGNFELDVVSTATQCANLGGQLCGLAEAAQSVSVSGGAAMNRTLHATGSVQIGEGRVAAERSMFLDVHRLDPVKGAEAGIILLTIADTLNNSFTLKMKLTALQAAQLGYQLCDLAQNANHGT